MKVIMFHRAHTNCKIDPVIRSLTRNKIKAETDEFRDLLDSKVDETIIHTFLATHSYFFQGPIRNSGLSPLYSKIKLGSNYEVDFAWFDTSSNGPEWCFAEIEAPSRHMFTATGDPSRWLTHAIQQVLDWHSWIHDNLGYATKLMPHVEYPRGFVFIGRRSELTPLKRKRLRRLCYEYRRTIEIHTLDWFVSAAQNFMNYVDDSKGGDWHIPSKAFGHSDLAKGVPADAFAWLNSEFANFAKKEYLEDSLDGREQDYEKNSDLFEEDM
jgi:hypothetical protein